MSKRSRKESVSDSTDESPAIASPPAPSSLDSLIPSKKHSLETAHPATEVMRCSLPPHRETLAFSSYEDYEVHYFQSHVNRCSECGKNFPTSHFLNLHIEENHDPLIAARRERGEKTYGCFIEDCERKCSTPNKRRMHLVDKHMFPRTYNFYIVNDGIDKQTSMLRPMNIHRRRISTSTSSPQEGRLRRRQSSQSQPSSPSTGAQEANRASQPKSDDMEIDELEKSMSALRFVPVSVTKKANKVRE